MALLEQQLSVEKKDIRKNPPISRRGLERSSLAMSEEPCYSEFL